VVLTFANGVEMKIKGACYHEQGGDSEARWVALPAHSWGPSKYAHIIEWTDDEAKAHFRKAAVAAVDRYRTEASNGIN
jgi:hypothetical protein